MLDTGGGLLHAKKFFQPGQPFLSCNADFLTDLNIHSLLARHKKEQALISFGVTTRPSSRYLLFDEQDRLCGWKNVKTGQTIIAREADPLIPMAYSCVVIYEYEVFRLMEEKGFTGKFSIIDVYLSLAPDHKIIGFDHTGDRLVDVGKPESVALAEELFK